MTKFKSLLFVSIIVLSVTSCSEKKTSDSQKETSCSEKEIPCSQKEEVVQITDSFIEAIHQYEILYPFSEGMAAVSKDGKYGFINTKGELVIPCKFNYVGIFSEGLACVVDENDLISFIDKEGVVKKTRYVLDHSNYIYFTKVSLLLPIKFVNGFCLFEVESFIEDGGGITKVVDKEMREVTDYSIPEDNTSDSIPSEILTKINENPLFQNETYLTDLKDSNNYNFDFSKYAQATKSDNGVAFIDIFIPDIHAQYYGGARDCGLFVYGYVDKFGNTTFTESDLNKIEEYKTEQIRYYYNELVNEAQNSSSSSEYFIEDSVVVEMPYLESDIQSKFPSRFESYSDLKRFLSNSPKFKCSDTKVELMLTYSEDNGYVAYVNGEKFGKVQTELNSSYPQIAMIGLPWLNGWGPAPVQLRLDEKRPCLYLLPVQGRENISVNSRGQLRSGRTNNTTWMQLSLSSDGVSFTPCNDYPAPEKFDFVGFNN